MSLLRVLAKLVLVVSIVLMFQACGKDKDEAPAPAPQVNSDPVAAATTPAADGTPINCVAVNPDGSANLTVVSKQDVQILTSGWFGPASAQPVSAINSGGDQYTRQNQVSSIDLFIFRKNSNQANFSASIRLEPSTVQAMRQIDANGQFTNQVCIDEVVFSSTELGADKKFGGTVWARSEACLYPYRGWCQL